VLRILKNFDLGFEMNMKKNNFIKNSETGFTLIELSIVMLIVSILIIPLFKIYESYLLQKKIIVTKENIAKAADEMSFMYANRVPCPSNRSLAMTHANFGREVCALPSIAAIPTCIAALNQGICKVRGTRNSYIGGNTVWNDWVIIGGLPFKDATGKQLGLLGGKDIVDGWGRKLNYAVSQRVMDTFSTSPANLYKYGVINAIDENGNQTAGVKEDTTSAGVPIPGTGNAMFVIWSSGADGSGAFDLMGTNLVKACDTTNRDGENCNNNGIFRQGIAVSDAGNANYFDDISYFYLQNAGDLWANAYISNAPTEHIYNLNTKYVGINTTTPQSPLHVVGNLSANSIRTYSLMQDFNDGANKTTTEVAENSTFFPLNAGCSPFGPFGGANTVPLQWNPVSQTFTCEVPKFSSSDPLKTVNCPAGERVRGVTTDRCVICSDGINDNLKCL
jgi:prepilin-type N-terminal cleavage/methylation domain-containing protein